MNQIEFFDSIKEKKMKEVTIVMDCGCQILYSPISEEVFGKPCSTHVNDM